ncbi:MAPEG family protein [Sphingomonas immobilis]|uniref:MAPEG family protein n=1 Tax=Sphingomonas immobilis TaxID=3063997 RepID=A0ABT9A3I6_9SPHN|nr:MAPEG family protein [Sphingomonas sp. CA1-15]MDO7844410.1 MAPEG family protein [Sphingomonas sp. CA1-15]
MPIGILWPTFALVALIFVVFVVMFYQRGRHTRANPPRDSDFATTEAAMRYFEPVEMPANNYRNLFEMPLLYFALVPLLLITRQADHLQIVLAWVYVILRIIHSFIHIGPKVVTWRAAAYALSALVLMAMWIVFFVDMLHAQAVISAAGG